MKSLRAFVFTLGIVFMTACNFTLAADVTPPPGYQPPPSMEEAPKITSGPLYPLLPPDPSNGEVIFLDKCAPCHGVSGLGDGPRASQLPNPVPPIGSSNVARIASPARWFEIVTQGNLERFMPPFQSLTDRQRWDVTAHIYSLSTSRSNLLQGAEIYENNCANCHGLRGMGDGQMAADSPAPLPDLTDQEFMADKSASDFYRVISEGIDPTMPAFEEELTESERWVVSDYLRWLTFSADLLAKEDEAQATPQAEEVSVIEPTSEVTSTVTITDTVTLGEDSTYNTVSGFVMNSSGGEVASGLPVMLHAFDHTQIVVTATTSLQDDATFAFPDVEVVEGRVFLATIEFDGVTYASETIAAQSDGEELQLPIQVFEATSDPSSLSVDRVHYFFELMDHQTVRVVELFIISNPTGETLVAPEEGQPVLEFNLPSGATNLEFQDGILGGRYLQTADGFGDTFPIRPGMGAYQILYSYELPFQRSLELSRPMNLGANAIVILMPADGLKVKGETIEDGGIRDVQGVQYHLYNGSGMPAGSTLSLTLSQNSSIFSSSSFTSLLLGAAGLGLVLVVAGVWLYRRNSTTEIPPEEEEQLPEPVVETAEIVMDAILALDDLYQEGQLPEEAYLERRSELKARLKDLLEE